MTPPPTRHTTFDLELDKLNDEFREYRVIDEDRNKERFLSLRQATDAAIVALRSSVSIEFIAAKEATAMALTAAKEATAMALTAAKEAVNAALAAAKEAVNKAEIATDGRFHSVNEFRAQLGDLIRTFIPRAEAEIRFKSIEAQITLLMAKSESNEGKGQGQARLISYIAMIVATIGALLAIVHFFIK